MALRKCPECGKDVSDSVPQCPHCGFKLRRRAPGFALGCFGLLAVLWIVGKFAGGPDEVAITPESSALARAVANAPPAPPPIPIESTTVMYRKLVPRMRYHADQVNNWGRFTHRDLPTTMWRRGLSLEVFPDGGVVLLSSYTASDWLFHSSVTVRAGEHTATTQSIESYDPQHYTDINGGEIAEQIRYTDDRGQAVIDLLRDSTIKSAIVRFNGRQYYNDVTMSATQLKAFREALRFADLQRTMNSSAGGAWRSIVPGAASK